MPSITTRVGRVSYTDTGTGPVVVLLHATLHDRRDFDPIVPALSRTHRVIARDWPGHGGSPSPDTAPSAVSYADALVDVVEALDLPPAAFVGNSVGGFAAARLAITNPDRVTRLVLVDTGGFLGGPVTNLYCRVMGVPAVLKRVLPRFIRSYLKPKNDHDRAIGERALARARTAEGVHLAAALWRSFAEPGYNLRPSADRIAVPTLVNRRTRPSRCGSDARRQRPFPARGSTFCPPGMSRSPRIRRDSLHWWFRFLRSGRREVDPSAQVAATPVAIHYW